MKYQSEMCWGIKRIFFPTFVERYLVILLISLSYYEYVPSPTSLSAIRPRTEIQTVLSNSLCRRRDPVKSGTQMYSALILKYFKSRTAEFEALKGFHDVTWENKNRTVPLSEYWCSHVTPPSTHVINSTIPSRIYTFWITLKL
jgi:hypothetical protein